MKTLHLLLRCLLFVLFCLPARSADLTGAHAVSWTKIYNGTGNSGDVATALAVDASGNVAVSGQSVGVSGSTDIYTAKYAAVTGALLWEKRYAGGVNFATAIVADPSGNIIITSSSRIIESQNSDYYTAKYAAGTGALLWERRYNGTGGSLDNPNSLAVDASGNVVVTGESANASGTFDYYTAKYAGATGAILWEKRYNGPGNLNDSASAVVIDKSGNVIVTGYAALSDSSHSCYTAKYAAANGALLWANLSTANGFESGAFAALDSTGNVFVTRFVPGSSGDADYYTAKYAASNGALIWEQRYNGVSNGNDNPSAIAVDAVGNVVVTGTSETPTTYKDYHTIKYATANGAKIWEQQYDGTGKGYDYAEAIAIDAAGNVVVAGASKGAGSRSDAHTIAYASANGALLWENRYNGSGNSDDSARDVKLDKSANVFVTGATYAPVGYDNYVTLKIAPITRVIALSGSMAFGSVPVGTTKTSTLTIRNTGTQPLSVTGITYPAGFSGAYAGTIPIGGSQNVTVTFKPTIVQAYSGVLTVNSNKTSGTNTLAVSGAGIAATRIIGLSGNLAFGSLPVGSSKTSVLTIRNTGNSPLSVTSIVYPSGFSGAYAGTIPVGGSQAVTVTFKPTVVQAYSGALTVNSNKTSGTNTLAVSGAGIAATRIIGLSGSMAFGKVKVGASKSLPLTIKNTGNSPLTVSSIAYSSGYSGTWSGTIPVGGSQVVLVLFKPTAAKAYNSTLTVNSNKTSGTNTLAVSGTGVR